MAFTQLTDDMDFIQKLDDEPNDVGGLSADELKAEFDKAGNAVKTYINGTLLPELAGQDASTWLGVYPLDDIPTATTIHEALLGAIDIAKQAQSGTLAPNIIETAMLQNLCVTEGKLGNTAVTTGKIADGSVTTAKLAASAVTTAKIADDAVTNAKVADDAIGTAQIIDKNVTGAKIADLGITNANLGTGCVTSAKIGDGEVKTANINDGAVTLGKLASAAKVHKAVLSVLAASWTGSVSPYSQVITVVGADITANTQIDLQPDATALAQMLTDGTTAMYIDNNNGTLTMYAITNKPTADLLLQATYYETI